MVPRWCGRRPTYAVFARGFEGGFAQLGMGGKAEIIVRGEIDNALPSKVQTGACSSSRTRSLK